MIDETPHPGSYRHVWINFKKMPGPGSEPMIFGSGGPSQLCPPLPFPEYATIPLSNAQANSFPEASRCIYCCKPETANSKRNDEHIISAGLGGNLILPSAVCSDCQTLTNEGKALGNMAAARYKLELKVKKRKRDLSEGVRLLGSKGWQRVPLKDHPTVLLLPVLAPPGELVGRKLNDRSFCGLYGMNIDATADKIAKLEGDGCAPTVVDLLAFTKLLAKIAHSYTAAKLADRFKPTLTDYILTEYGEDANLPADLYRYIGGDIEKRDPSNALHEIGLTFFQHGNSKILSMVKIRLFAMHGAPIYYLITGECDTSRLTLRKGRKHKIAFKQ